LQDKIHSLVTRLKSQEQLDVSTLQKTLAKRKEKIDLLEGEKANMEKLCRHFELERDREIMFAKHQVLR
jgi:hypothetical protein